MRILEPSHQYVNITSLLLRKNGLLFRCGGDHNVSDPLQHQLHNFACSVVEAVVDTALVDGSHSANVKLTIVKLKSFGCMNDENG